MYQNPCRPSRAPSEPHARNPWACVVYPRPLRSPYHTIPHPGRPPLSGGGAQPLPLGCGVGGLPPPPTPDPLSPTRSVGVGSSPTHGEVWPTPPHTVEVGVGFPPTHGAGGLGSLAIPSITCTSAAISCIAMTMVPDRVRVCGVAGCDQATRTLARDGDEPPNSTLNLEPPPITWSSARPERLRPSPRAPGKLVQACLDFSLAGEASA